jgi:hypothetical protein
MYFRFPLLLILVASIIIGVIFFKNKIPGANPPSTVVPTTSLEPGLPESRPSESIKKRDLKTHLEFLADDLLQGRDTGSFGGRIASLYIASQFEKFGLVAPVGGTSYFQDIQFATVVSTPNTTMEIEVDGEMISLSYEEDFIVSSFPWRSGETVSATMVFTGYGIEAPEYGYSDFEQVDITERVTIFMSGEPKDGTSSFFEGDEVSSQYALASSKRVIAKEKGSVASINLVHPSILEQTDWDRIRAFTQSRNMRIQDEGLAFPSIVLHPKVGELLFSGTSKTFEAICEDAETGRFTSFESNKRVRLTIHFEEDILSDRNVIAELPGSDPSLKDEVVIFCAHYDHIGIGKAMEQDSIYNGAIDNASGVSALLELAEAFSMVEPAPARSVLFIAFTAEEKGLLGSRYYSRFPTHPIRNMIGVINFDMIGIGDSTGIVVYGYEKSTIGDVIKRAAESAGLRIIPDELPEQRIFYRSDHYNFDREGVPSVLTGLGLRRDNLEQYRSYYHQPVDDATLPINYSYMQKHTVALLAAGLELANARERPHWKERRP